MARTIRAFPLALALGAALAAPSTAQAINGGAAPTATLASAGGAAPDGPSGAPVTGPPQGAAAPGVTPSPSAPAPARKGRRRGASSARTGGAVPGRKPPRRSAKAPAKRRAARPPKKRATPPPPPPPAPETPAPAPAAPPVGGSFPVQGAYTFGGDGARFGAGRPTHTHQGQDIVAASGTPIVSPVAGTVAWKANQPGGAGIYLIVRGAADGRDYVFMHLLAGSVVVAAGETVAAGQQIAQVGATGIASGPHLHFEIWVGGWQQRGGAPIDPLPQLQAWAAGA